jgi:HEAT repeat protein
MARWIPLFLTIALALGCKKKPEVQDAGAPAAARAPSPQSWQEAIKSPDPNVRAEALKSVSPERHTSVPPDLLAALSDDHPSVRKAAIKGILGFELKYADARALPKLLELAEKDPEVQVRAEAVRALGALSHRNLVPSLVRIFPNEKNESIRDEILAVFEREGDRRAVPVLLSLLKEQHPPPLVFDALKRIADPQSSAAILPLLDHPSGAIRSRAIQVMGEIGDAAAVKKLLPALGDKDPGIVREAISAVAAIGAAEAVPLLLRLCDHRDAKIRRSAIRSLATYRNPEVISVRVALPIVLAHLRKDTDDIRVEAARVLGLMQVKRALPELQAAAGERNTLPVRLAALGAIGLLSEAKAIPFLTAALSDKDPDVRTEAAKGLGQYGRAAASAGGAIRDAFPKETDLDAKKFLLRAMGLVRDAAAVPLLTKVGSQDPVPLLRIEAGGALLRLGHGEGKNVLRSVLLGASDWQERRAAVRAIDPATAVPSVADVIGEALDKEKEPLVREALYRKLGAAVGKAAAAQQRKALSEPVPFFRLIAADGLCGNGDPAGCEALIRGLSDPEANVRAEAARRLGNLTVVDAVPALRKATDDPVVWVANAARRALARIEAAPSR